VKEGWHNNDYLILFEGGEIEEKEKEYEIDRLLPGCGLLGIFHGDHVQAVKYWNQLYSDLKRKP
jgi:hypothetical protein